MLGTRRAFLCTFSSAAAVFSGALALAQSQNPRPRPAEPTKDDEPSPSLPPTKAVLEGNEKDIKKNVERLFQLASELKAEVEKTDSVKVLSLALLRKADEIEKLAREIKSRAKG